MLDAKTNVQKYYLLVGILEDFETFLKLFKRLLPEFSKGWPLDSFLDKRSISKIIVLSFETIYNSISLDSGGRTNSTLTPLAQNTMRRRLAYEYEFYDFVKKEFHDLASKTL